MSLEDLQKRAVDPLLGQTIGHVLLDRWMADSDTGTVYFGHHSLSKSEVVVKVILPALSSRPGFAEKFLFEARLAQQLNHPNIVRVIEAGNTGGHVYVAMEFVRGEPLEALVRKEQRLDFDRATRVLRDIARGLDVAHDLELVHRDIRPRNILMDSDGMPKINNFGLARRASTGSGRTMMGELVGPPEFQSPEQVSGQIVDAKSDLYSLGLIYYYMLTGEIPFTGVNDADIAKARLTRDVPTLENIPLAGRQLMGRLTARDPKGRFPNAKEVAAACERALYGREETKGTKEYAQGPTKPVRKAATKNERHGMTVLPTMMWFPAPKLRGATVMYLLATGFAVAAGGYKETSVAARSGLVAAALIALLAEAWFVFKQKTGLKGAFGILLSFAGVACGVWGAASAPAWRDMAVRFNVIALGGTLVLSVLVTCIGGFERARGRPLLILCGYGLVGYGAWATAPWMDWLQAAPVKVLALGSATLLAGFCGAYLAPHAALSRTVRFVGMISALAACAGLAYICSQGDILRLTDHFAANVARHGTAVLATLFFGACGYAVLKFQK